MRVAAAAVLLASLCTCTAGPPTTPPATTPQPTAPTLRPTPQETTTPTLRPTHEPTLAPTAAPTLDLNSQRNSWGFVLGIVQLYAATMVLLLIFREVFRRRAYVYASRRPLTQTRLAKLGARGERLERHARPVGGFCDWARRAVACPDDALLELHGLDAYACCSFLALGVRLAAFCCALGCLGLLPIYYWAARPLAPAISSAIDSATRDRAAFARVTLGAVATDASDRARARTAAWAAVLGAWIVALEVYRAVRARYRAYRDARLAWLLRGDPDWPRAASYTVCLQHLPPALRDDAALKHHLETLFPNEVSAVRVVVPLNERRGRCDAFFAKLKERVRGRGLREGLLDGSDDLDLDGHRGGVDAHLPFLMEELYLLVRGRPSRSTAFVTFSTLRAATVAASVKLSHRAFTVVASMAPRPPDVLWAHAATSLRQRRLRTWAVDYVAVPICGVLFLTLLSYVAAVFRRDGVEEWCATYLAPLLVSLSGVVTKRQNLNDATTFTTRALATGGGLLVLLVVPWVSYAVTIFYERPLDRRAVETTVFRRYVVFQFLWIYGSIVSLSVEDLTHIARRNPREALELVAGRVADSAGYFVSAVVVKTTFGLAWELARGWALVSKTFVKEVSRRRGNPFAHEVECDPARYGWILPNVVVVCCILLTFSVITPLVAPFALAYFAAAYVVYKHQLLHVYAPPCQLGGAFLPMLLQSLLVALTGAQIVLIGVFTSSRDWGLAAAVAPLPFVSQLVALAYRIGYHDLLDGVPLNVAVKVDRSAGGVGDDGESAYAPPGEPGTNPLLQHVARLSDAGSRPPTPDRARRRRSEDSSEGSTDADDAA